MNLRSERGGLPRARLDAISRFQRLPEENG
jgi:hypothetical protein